MVDFFTTLYVHEDVVDAATDPGAQDASYVAPGEEAQLGDIPWEQFRHGY